MFFIVMMMVVVQAQSPDGIPDSLTCMATSSSGELMAFGTMEGTVIRVRRYIVQSRPSLRNDY